MADYFVRVEDSTNLRRSLLESSKLCIQILKQEHELTILRKHKAQLTAQAEDDLKELTVLVSELEKRLPSLTKKELHTIKPPQKEKKSKSKKGKKGKKGKSSKSSADSKESAASEKPVEKKPELTKLQKLEKSLQMIESRLEKL